ncbi:hypothetical protein SAY86_026209 [Trapa natans]|uniref:S-acyltransferase n=1 Tax=Trapa natans TaxID=22666 RepID=A0AAN7KHJ0_TRANT|nr:hypothetical protein SAY86_026209 [Trapa natans]
MLFISFQRPSEIQIRFLVRAESVRSRPPRREVEGGERPKETASSLYPSSSSYTSCILKISIFLSPSKPSYSQETRHMVDFPEGRIEALTYEENAKKCWGCGLRILLPSDTSVFRCGWCGAITNLNSGGNDKDKSLWWRCVRDRCFVCIVSLFMLFVICGGVWAVYPIVFSISLSCGVFHCCLTFLLAVSTLSAFCFAAFRPAGTPPTIIWGSYPVVGKGELHDYTFCHYCLKPKSPQTHHCRSCGTCVFDMDHHCPFIGNCVGASNHRHFIAFLILTILSTFYITIMCTFAALRTWPPLPLSMSLLTHRYRFSSTHLATGLVKEFVFALLNSIFLLSTRGVILVYLIVASISIQIGLCVLLWQQLCYIIEGETYLSQLSSSSQGNNRVGEKDCGNILRFFGCPHSVSRHLSIFHRSRKRHKK